MSIRLSKAFKEFNISLDRAVEFLSSKGIEIEKNPNVKIEDEHYALLAQEFGADKQAKAEAAELFGNRSAEKQQAKEEQFKQFEKTPEGQIQQITRSYNPGRTVSLSISYKMN